VLPIIRKVILVQKPLAEAEAKVSQPDTSRVIGKTNAPLIGDTVLLPVNEKAMEMTVRPPHSQLKDVMKICERSLGVDKEATPDQGTDAA
jgi:hypothetical protein